MAEVDDPCWNMASPDFNLASCYPEDVASSDGSAPAEPGDADGGTKSGSGCAGLALQGSMLWLLLMVLGFGRLSLPDC